MKQEENKVRVAIVGTGMAGLTTAYLLSHDEQNRYDVTLLEKVSGCSASFPSEMLHFVCPFADELCARRETD